MSFDVEGAKKAGYSDAEIQSFLNQQKVSSNVPRNFDTEAAKSAGYSDAEIQKFLKQQSISKARSVASAPAKGTIKGAEELSHLADPVQMILNQFAPQKKSLLSHVTEEVLPTKDEALENYLQRTFKIAPSVALGGGTIPATILASLVGGALGELAKEEGASELGQSIAELVGAGIPGLVKGIGKGAVSLLKTPKQKLPSGLTKPSAVGAKFPEKGIVSPSRQQKALSDLNKEATALAESTLKKEVPIVEQIRTGTDFEGQFEKRFGTLQKMAEKANPEIEIEPLSEFMADTLKKYRGIPELHPEAKKISTEVDAFYTRPPEDLRSALRTYRSNNKKIRNIYETSRLTGKQQEYVDFLVDYNRNIAKSFKETLPPDSAWVKEFENTNKFYKDYQDGLKTLNHLKPILGENSTPASIKKLASDGRLQKKLELSMGKKGAEEIIQIAKDLDLASTAIKKIPAREIKIWDAVFPLGVLIPGAKVPSAALSIKKGADWFRRGYGIFLTSPERRRSYSEALKAINEGNKTLYIKAIKDLEDFLKEESK